MQKKTSCGTPQTYVCWSHVPRSDLSAEQQCEGVSAAEYKKYLGVLLSRAIHHRPATLDVFFPSEVAGVVYQSLIVSMGEFWA